MKKKNNANNTNGSGNLNNDTLHFFDRIKPEDLNELEFIELNDGYSPYGLNTISPDADLEQSN
ncbi:hypothetical protein [Bacillus cereus]|uniref:hypothetical protein n=1 Tax=Bacillus cereus TaxID=1396 RepID=UPI000B4A6D52|nr:hypothetical protein [Bacillus cereus]